MAIRVRHEDLAGGVQAAQIVGQGQGALAADKMNADMTRFLLGMGEQQRQFDVNAGLRLDDNRREDQRYYSQLAMQDQRQRGLLWNQDQERQAELMRRQMMGEQQLAQEQLQHQYDWMAEGAKTLDQQVVEALKGANQLKLTPEGQRIRNEWAGKLRQAQSQRSTLRPDAYNQALGQALAEYHQLGLEAYEEQVPTRDEWFASTTWTDEDGTVYGEDRSGKPRVLKEAPPKKLSPQEIALATVPLPPSIGGAIFTNPHTGKELYIPPRKAEKAEEVKPLLPATDRDTFYKSIRDALRKEWEADLEEETKPGPKGADGQPGKPVGTGRFKHPEGLSFHDYFRKHWKDEVGVFNEMFGDPDTETMVPSEQQAGGGLPGASENFIYDERRNQTRRLAPFEQDLVDRIPEATQVLASQEQEETRPIVTNPAGRRAYLNPDGTVELID